jgi:hypothetical protein
MLKLFVPVLRTHVLCKIFEITTCDINHFFLGNSFTRTFRLYFSRWTIVLYTIFTVESCILFTVLLLNIFRHHVLVFLAVTLISFLKVSKILVVLKIKESWIVMLIEVLLRRLIRLLNLLLNFQLGHFTLSFF